MHCWVTKCRQVDLLNTIAKESLAITSGTPGTTRDLIRAEIDLGGVVVEFIDTAGIRENPDNDIEREGVQRSLSAIETSNLNLIIRDITDKDSLDIEIDNFLTVMNKCDLVKDEVFKKKDVMYVSSLTGQGISELIVRNLSQGSE